jgi:hypothetical protein
VSGRHYDIAAEVQAQYFPHWANSGGPASRTVSSRLTSSLLGESQGPVRCPRVLRLALDFGKADPVDCVNRLLTRARLGSAEELRATVAAPGGRLLASPIPEPAQRLDVRTAPAAEVLGQALLLGLCTSFLYDPARPVLWTTKSLTRALELFDPAGFYA